MPKTFQIIQLGLGGVGQALVQQVLASNAQSHITLEYQAIADSSGVLLAPLDEQSLRQVCTFKQQGGRLREHEKGQSLENPHQLVSDVGNATTILVDTTAAAPHLVMPALELILKKEGAVVLANKKPLTDSWEAWQTLTAAGRTRYEATVGAGLPVISTLQYLLETGDHVQKIEGAFSGTLGFVMSELQRGSPFANVVREAKAKGWTEPDPRDDLSGTDVARKALILARTLGLPMSLEQVSVTALYPSAWEALSLDEFMSRLDELNPKLARQRDAAHNNNQRLRYAATVTPTALTVGPAVVPPDSPLGVLSGPDNLVAFHTQRYGSRPLVVQGAGAGVEVTASAVLGDILRLCREHLS